MPATAHVTEMKNRRLAQWSIVGFLLFIAGGCLGGSGKSGNPCNKYVDYLCDCMSEAECEDTETRYENADSDLKDECSASLDEAKEASRECQAGEGSG
jgi:hypothetical protein